MQDNQELKQVIGRFTAIDNQVKLMNQQITKLREQRSIVEMEIADFLRSPQYSNFKMIAVDDGSKIKVQRPNEWNKPWNLSKGCLLLSLNDYFRSTNNPNFNDCFEYIMNIQKQKTTSNEFKLTRIIEDENVDNE